MRKKQYNNEKTEESNVNDLESAECAIIWASHINTSMEELATLKKIKHESTDLDRRVFAQKRKHRIKTYSSLYKLDPFVDAHRILRVGGLLRRTSLSDEIKFPIMLP